MSVLVSGSIGIDKVKTPKDFRKNLLGGSAAYAAVSSSYFCDTNLVGVVGEDFPNEHTDLISKLGINIDGLEVVKGGKTFRWTGEYHENMNERETLEVDLNVLENFEPKIPKSICDSKIILLANMSPQAQMQTLSNCSDPKFVIMDTMDLWINIGRFELDSVMKKANMLVLNDSEAKLFSGHDNLIQAGLSFKEFGLDYVIIKKGEHGAIVFGKDVEDIYMISAYPINDLVDPTGAGDSFVGALAGYLGSLDTKKEFSFENICQGVIYGTVMASFNCESFSMDKLAKLSKHDINERIKYLTKINTPPKI